MLLIYIIMWYYVDVIMVRECIMDQAEFKNEIIEGRNAVIEALRTDSLWLFGEGTIRVSQAVGIITCIIGIVIAVFGVLKAYKGIDVWGNITSKLQKKDSK